MSSSSSSMDCVSSKDKETDPPKAWWTGETVAVVTGANRGIGLALAARLAERGLSVVLTARDEARGEAAAAAIRASSRAAGLRGAVWFRRLDVAQPASVAAFASWVRDELGGLDILVNNAAVSFNEIDTNSVEHAETVLRTNFYGAKMLTEALLPLFRRAPTTSRILNISSQLGLLNKLKDPALRRMLLDEAALTERDIDGMVSRFLAEVGDGTWRGRGWPEVWTDYAVSKLALNAYSRLLASRLAGDGVSVNCFCPGFTRTDMTRGFGKRTAEEVGRVAAGLALLPPRDLPTGKFFKWRTPQLYSKL
ncbi:(+)-neomenthol dehydrogenase [Dichanthelium oligosanthes]|uniref:(+)-neomenthol dehydrogenase n=1 Tax=Dichanthelium oligosanthes TaxID=888268 RepID=A0A1E5V3H3_9POAL|nr:(+)-neomenthol dehydrogenase [Dichanthelium oligosanthes]